nr:zinc finger MYM-type protein 1-like [Tanacetum cinerariifolium]
YQSRRKKHDVTVEHHYRVDVFIVAIDNQLQELNDRFRLQETEKSETHPLIDRLIRLILTLPVSTATSERAFSKMKLVKTRLRRTMSDGFLKSSLILSVEREIVRTLCTNNIIDDFYSKTQRRVQMKKRKVP